MDSSQKFSKVQDAVARMGYSQFLKALVALMESDLRYAKGGGYEMSPAAERVWRRKLKNALQHVRAARKSAGSMY